MREFFKGRGVARRFATVALVATAGVAVPAVFATAASAVTNEVTVSAAWTQNPIVAGGPLSIVYTIKGNDSTGTVINNVGFSDTLPAGVTLSGSAAANGALKNCSGPAGQQDYTESGSSLTVSGLSLTSGTSCTVSFYVDPSTVGTGLLDDITGVTLTSSGGNGVGSATEAAALNVLADPTVHVSVPANKHTYKWGQSVKTHWTATVAAGDSFAGTDLYGIDDLLDQLSSGDPLNTWVVGTHTLTVFLTTADLGSVTDVVTYKVSGLALSKLSQTSAGAVSYKTTYVSKGQLQVKLLHGSKVIGRLSKKIKKKGAATETVNPTAAGKALIAKSGSKGVKATLEVNFTPAKHPKSTVKKTITLK